MKSSVKLAALLTVLSFSSLAESAMEEVLSIRDCGVYLEPYVFNRGTIFRLLERDGLTEESLNARMTELDGTTSPHLYRTRRGFGFVIKEGADARKEVAAYQISLRAGLKNLPQTEGFRLGKRFYSAAKEIPTQKLAVIGPSGKTRMMKLETVCKTPVSDEFILRDALLMNSDRLPRGHNYILHAEKLPKSYRSTRGPFAPKKVAYIAIDHGSAFMDWKFDLWFMKYQRLVDLQEAQFLAILRRNPDFVARLREWTPAAIRRELRDLLDPDELAAFLKRRKFLIRLYDRGFG